MNRWIDGWLNGWMHGQTDVWYGNDCLLVSEPVSLLVDVLEQQLGQPLIHS